MFRSTKYWQRYFAVVGFIGAFCIASFVLCIASASAQSAATLSVSVNGKTGTSFAVGDNWTLTVASNQANQPISICAIGPDGGQSCTPAMQMGYNGWTDSDGSWSAFGTFPTSTVGTWKEWIWNPSGFQSNVITFTVGSSGTNASQDTNTSSSGGSSCAPQLYNVIQQLQTIVASALTTNNLTPTVIAGLQNLASQIAAAIASWNCAVSSTDTTATNNSSSVDTGSSVVSSVSSNISFPATILVTASSLNVRSAPNTSASLAGSQVLSTGDTFTATNEVIGENVNGNDLWWVSSAGNYVWSGGTEVSQGAQATQTATTKKTGGLSARDRANLATTKTITDQNGNMSQVSYSYLPDGEAAASYAVQNQNYIWQDDQVGLVNADGSITDCSTMYVMSAACGLGFVLGTQIAAAAPANEFPPGLIFATPPGTAASTYLINGLYPVTLATDANGNVVSAQGVTTTGYGSGIYWYNLGGGYYVIDTGTSGYAYLKGGDVPNGYAVIIENPQADNTNNPTTLTGEIAVISNAQLSASGFNNLPQATAPITFAVQSAPASQTVSASGLAVTAIPNSPTSLIAAIVTNNGALQDVVNAGGVAAYQYIQARNSNAVTVSPVANNGYAVMSSADALVVLFDQNGNQLTINGSVVTSTVLGNMMPSDYLASLLSGFQNNGYQVSEAQSGDGDSVGLVTNNGGIALSFSLGDQVVTGLPANASDVCVVNATDGTPVPVLVASNGDGTGVVPHLDKNFNIAVDPSVYSLWQNVPPYNTSPSPTADIQNELIGVFNEAYSPYAQIGGLPQPIPGQEADAIVILSYAYIPPEDNWTMLNGVYGNYPAPIAADALTLIPGQTSWGNVPAGSSGAILNALKAGKEVMIITLNTAVYGPSATSDNMENQLVNTLRHEMGHPLGLGDDYENQQSPMRESTSSVPVGVSPSIASVLSAIQQKKQMSTSNCGTFTPGVNINTMPTQEHQGYVPIAPISQTGGGIQWGYAGTCTQSQLDDGWTSVPACTGNIPPSWCNGITTGCYLPATSTESYVIADGNFPSQPGGTCRDNENTIYYCSATNCNGPGQLKCPANIPLTTCLDASGNSVTCETSVLAPATQGVACVVFNPDCSSTPGNVGATDENGVCNAIPPVCPLPSSALSGGYDCSTDNYQCTYSQFGGDYSDLDSCEEACQN